MQTNLIAYQDGGQFYDSENGALIVDYSNLVSGDYDMAGAAAARAQFISEYPQFTIARNADFDEYEDGDIAPDHWTIDN